MSAPVRITRAPADPICLRISVGGTPEIGYYTVYRGDLDECVAAMEASLAALKQVQSLPPSMRPKIDPKFKAVTKPFNASNS